MIIDVSRANGTLDWSALRDAGVVGAILKATEGVGWKDPTFDYNLEGARRTMRYVAAYHFARNDTIGGRADGEAEAEWCASVVPGDVPLWLDVEKYTPQTMGEDREYVLGFLGRYHHLRGPAVPGIYTGANVWRFQLGDWWPTVAGAVPEAWIAAYRRGVTAEDPLRGCKALPVVPVLRQWSGGGRYSYGPEVCGKRIDLNWPTEKFWTTRV